MHRRVLLVVAALTISSVTSPTWATPAQAKPVSRVLVKFRNSTHVPATLNIPGQSLGKSVVHRPNSAGIATVELPSATDRAQAQALAHSIAALPEVAWAVADQWAHTALAVPDDPYYTANNQWGLTGPFGIAAALGWEMTTGSATTNVAVIDTGITDHEDLVGQVLAGYDMVSDATVAHDGQAGALDDRDADAHDTGDFYTSAGKVVPSSWHGTHVAGIIAALQGNAIGISGAAPAVRVQPIRALGSGGGSVADILDAIVWAAGGQVPGVDGLNPTPAKVINLSLGWDGACDAATQTAIDFAYEQGVAVVVAAGNVGQDAANYSPGSCRHTITVGSVSSGGLRSSYSNYGTAVDVSAPGEAIYSTLNAGRTSPKASPAGYGALSGTSMAAPFVSSAVALMVSRDPTWTLPQIINRLRDPRFATPFGAPACDPDPALSCGAGIVNIAKLLGSQPVVADPVGTADGYRTDILNFDDGLTYAATSSGGTATFEPPAGRQMALVVAGLLPSQVDNTSVAITAGISVPSTTEVIGTSLCAAVIPVIGSVTRKPSGFVVPITNFDQAQVWTATSTAGTALVDAVAHTATVSGLAPNQEAVLSVLATATGCATGTSQATAQALPPVTLSAVGGLSVVRTRAGLVVRWASAGIQDGRAIGVRVRVSYPNSTRMYLWVNRGTRTWWGTTLRARGVYRVQVSQIYGGRVGPTTTVKVRW